jgi:hypothetical protein
VRRALRALAELAAQITFVHEVVRADPVDLGPAVTLGEVGRTALVNAALGRGVVTTPLERADLTRLAALEAAAPAAEAAARAHAQARGVALPQEFQEVVRSWMGDLDWLNVLRSHA